MNLGDIFGKEKVTDELIGIGAVAKLLDVTIDTLRVWDKNGRLPSVRTSGGHREYRLGDVSAFMKTYQKRKHVKK